MVYQFVFFLSFFQGLLFLGHWFLYKTLARFFLIGNPAVFLALKIILGLASVSFLISSLLVFRYGNLFVRFLYYVSAAWLGAFFYLLVSAVALWIIQGLAGLFSKPWNFQFLGIILFSLAVLVSVYGVFNARYLRIRHLEIALPNLPPGWQGKTAVFISDTHFGPIWQRNSAEKIVEYINDLEPAVVFMGGDFYDGGTGLDPDALAEPFLKIKAAGGIFFVTGNHDEMSNDAAHLSALRRAGFKILSDETVDLNGLQIGGVSYKNFTRDENFKQTLDKLRFDPDKPSILLKHVPSNFAEVSEKGISLMLSGHVHRGQIFPFNLITTRIYRGSGAGLNRLGNTFFYASDGAGTWGPPLRVGSQSEIVAITFRRRP